MIQRIRKAKHGPEWYIQKDLIEFLRSREWLVERMIGNAFQTGIPDLYVRHLKWGERWIDVKNSKSYSFTKAQRIKWPIWEAFGVGIWILTGATQQQYDLLMGPPNWRNYWKDSYGELPDIDALLDLINLEDTSDDRRYRKFLRGSQQWSHPHPSPGCHSSRFRCRQVHSLPLNVRYADLLATASR